MQVKLAKAGDANLLWPTIFELRPNLKQETFQEIFNKQRKEGYQIVFIGDENMAFALAGFRTLNHFFSGKTLYIDDLVTHTNHLKKGYAGQLLDWIKDYAKENDYNQLSLDSGFLRKDAHRLYLNKGLEVASLHFGRRVSEL
jgi:GNAT superfamily N-acetyltransferase